MISHSLFELAIAYKKTKLWKKLGDSELFAVRHSDGTIGYCCVMGNEGVHQALAVYPGADGLSSYRLMAAGADLHGRNARREIALSQNCIMVSYQNKSQLRPPELEEISAYCKTSGYVMRGQKAFPQFESYRPHYFPWYDLSQREQLYLTEALRAALDVAMKLESSPKEALGFTYGAPFDRDIPLLTPEKNGYAWETYSFPAAGPTVYPCAQIEDELALTRIVKKKKTSVWACHVFMHVEPVAPELDSDGEPLAQPYYPYVLVILDERSGTVQTLSVADDPDDYTRSFAQAVAKNAQITGRPSRILVKDERTNAFFEKIAGQLGASLEMKDSIPSLDDFLDDFFDQFGLNDEDDDENLLDVLGIALENPHALRSMPDELFSALLEMADSGEIPEEFAANIFQEARRRFLL